MYEPLYVSDRFEGLDGKELPGGTGEVRIGTAGNGAVNTGSAGNVTLSKTRRLLAPQWQWNHVSDDGLWDILPEGGLRIATGKTCVNLTQARNTLTQRMCYPACEAEVTVDAGALRDGDRAGMVAMQGCYAMIGIARENGRYYLKIIEKKEPAEGFGIGGNDNEPGEVTYREELTEVFAGVPSQTPLGTAAGVCPVTVGIAAEFTDMKDTVSFFVRKGDEKIAVGGTHKMHFRLDHFTGARFGLCVWSEKETGGSAVFRDFIYRVNRA